ncbi:MAG: YSC84-related protein [Paracoccaceae bacterium]
MTVTSRRIFTAGALSALAFTAACGNGVGGNGADRIDARVDATLSRMYSDFPNTRQLAEKSTGMLVMPLMTEAGLGLGGAYGRGALRVNGGTVDYYSAARASAGLQIGAQQYTHVLFFMTEDALSEFRSSPGWAAGADVEYVFNDIGESLKAETTTTRTPVVAVVFGQAGLRLGATLEGTKYTRIIP